MMSQTAHLAVCWTGCMTPSRDLESLDVFHKRVLMMSQTANVAVSRKLDVWVIVGFSQDDAIKSRRFFQCMSHSGRGFSQPADQSEARWRHRRPMGEEMRGRRKKKGEEGKKKDEAIRTPCWERLSIKEPTEEGFGIRFSTVGFNLHSSFAILFGLSSVSSLEFWKMSGPLDSVSTKWMFRFLFS
jgi:hypothetical protein